MVFRCLRKSAKKKKKKKKNSDGAHLYFLVSSTFLWCCNFLISALEQTLSGCLLSISFDFTPFPVKLISARTGIQTNTCRCISPNGHDASNLDPMSQEIFVDKFRSWNAPAMCSWLRWTLKSRCCPSCQIFGAVQIRTKALLPRPGATVSSNREEERLPEPITGFESRVLTTNWCTRESCRPMTKEVDCLCCHESAGALAMSNGLRCITLHDDFSSICLNSVVLRVCLLGYQELWNSTSFLMMPCLSGQWG